MKAIFLLFALLGVLHYVLLARSAVVETGAAGTVELNDLSAHKAGTDANVVENDELRTSADGYSQAELKAMRAGAQQHTFQAEVSRLMSIIINSLYSNKEIFLREAISNGSDALDKIRFLAVGDPAQLGEGELAFLKIKIRPDKEAKQLHIIDNGVGMTHDDLVSLLGTIAKSGTKEFLSQLQKGSDTSSSLIGQFGVGFYSYFLVADRVMVTSKHNDDDQYVWESDANSGAFSVAKDPKGNTLGRGTRVTLFLKEEFEYLLNPVDLERLVAKHSEFINFPIYLWSSTDKTEEVPIPEEEIEALKAEQDKKDEAVDLGDETAEEAAAGVIPTTKQVTTTTWDWKLLNAVKPIWTRKPSDITDEEYQSFYRSMSKDSGDALAYTHFNAEGDVEFQSILYIPEKPPQGMFTAEAEKDMAKRVKLYVRRVFITDNFEQMLPRYLMFITGMVDSLDMPLNVSREILQQDRTLVQIKRKLVRKALSMIQSLAEDTTKYDTFWKHYGNNIKLGVVEDKENRARLSKLLRFHTTKSGDSKISLDTYVERMKKDQKDIYFLCGESQAVVNNSPLIEQLVRRGYEVVMGVDSIDEYALGTLERYDTKFRLVNVGKDDFKLPFEETEAAKEDQKAQDQLFAPLLNWFKKHTPAMIDRVTISHRLATSPCGIAASGYYGMSANMERIAKAQALQTGENPMANMYNKKQLELNPRHPIVLELLSRVTEDENDKAANDIAGLLIDTALLHSGYSVQDSRAFSDRIARMLQTSLGLHADIAVQLEDLPEDDAEAEPAVDAAAPADEAEGLKADL